MNTPQQIYHFACVNKNSVDPNDEKILSSDPKYAFLYAFNVLKSRFPLGESVIATIPTYKKMYERCFGSINTPPGIFEKQISQILEAKDSGVTPLDDVRKTVADFFDKLEKKFHLDIHQAGIAIRKENLADQIRKFTINYFKKSNLSPDWKDLFVSKMQHSPIGLHVFMVLQHWASLYMI